MDSTTMTIRLPTALKKQLDQLAEATARSKSWLAADAIQAYVALQRWQIAEIEAGLREAMADDFAPADEVAAVFDRWAVDED